MYKNDSLTVKREIHEIIDGEASNYLLQTIYENLPCHLSVGLKNTTTIHEIPYLISEYTVFLDYNPNISIKENDKLLVTTPYGQKYELISGEVKIYRLSVQIKCRQEKIIESLK